MCVKTLIAAWSVDCKFMLVEVQMELNPNCITLDFFWTFFHFRYQWSYWQQTLVMKQFTITWPVSVWLDGRSNIRVLLVKIGLLAKAETSVDFWWNQKRKYLNILVNDCDLVLKIFGELDVMNWNWKFGLFNHYLKL